MDAADVCGVFVALLEAYLSDYAISQLAIDSMLVMAGQLLRHYSPDLEVFRVVGATPGSTSGRIVGGQELVDLVDIARCVIHSNDPPDGGFPPIFVSSAPGIKRNILWLGSLKVVGRCYSSMLPHFE